MTSDGLARMMHQTRNGKIGGTIVNYTIATGTVLMTMASLLNMQTLLITTDTSTVMMVKTKVAQMMNSCVAMVPQYHMIG